MDKDRKKDKVILYETNPRLSTPEDHKKGNPPYDDANRMIDHDDEKK